MFALSVAVMTWLIVFPGATARCSSADWTPFQVYTRFPLMTPTTLLKASPYNQVSAVSPIDGSGGMRFLASNNGKNDTYYNQSLPSFVAAENKLGNAQWNEQPYFTGANCSDFYMFNWNKTVTSLLYINNSATELWIVDQNPDTKLWSNNRLIFANSSPMRFPTASIVTKQTGTAVWMGVQFIGNHTIAMFVSHDGLSTFSHAGFAHNGTHDITPEGQYTMFTGTVDGGTQQTLWFYYIHDFLSRPLLSYATNYANGVQLSTPQPWGDSLMYNTSSVVAIANTDLKRAVLIRTGFIAWDSDYSVAVYTPIKLSSGPVSAFCPEWLIEWVISEDVVMGLQARPRWSPALTLNPLGYGLGDSVGLMWVGLQWNFYAYVYALVGDYEIWG